MGPRPSPVNGCVWSHCSKAQPAGLGFCRARLLVPGDGVYPMGYVMGYVRRYVMGYVMGYVINGREKLLRTCVASTVKGGCGGRGSGNTKR